MSPFSPIQYSYVREKRGTNNEIKSTEFSMQVITIMLKNITIMMGFEK